MESLLSRMISMNSVRWGAGIWENGALNENDEPER